MMKQCLACADANRLVVVMQIVMTVNSVVLCYLCSPIKPSKDAAACKVTLCFQAVSMSAHLQAAVKASYSNSHLGVCSA